MKKNLFTILFLLSFCIAKADLGLPTIQAICKVSLKDGSVVEGMISFGGGGYEFHYRPHGFCFVHEQGAVSMMLYGFDFRTLEPHRYPPFKAGKARLYYLQNQNVQRAPETTYGIFDSTHVLSRSTVDQDDFQMMDSMCMYRALPLSMYLDPEYSPESSKIYVDVNDIQSVEILKNPGKAWLDVIKAARKRHAGEAGDVEDYQEPVWYHEIIGDAARVAELKKYF